MSEQIGALKFTSEFMWSGQACVLDRYNVKVILDHHTCQNRDLQAAVDSDVHTPGCCPCILMLTSAAYLEVLRSAITSVVYKHSWRTDDRAQSPHSK